MPLTQGEREGKQWGNSKQKQWHNGLGDFSDGSPQTTNKHYIKAAPQLIFTKPLL